MPVILPKEAEAAWTEMKQTDEPLGRILERGTHAELLALGGRHAYMWQLQQSNEYAGQIVMI